MKSVSFGLMTVVAFGLPLAATAQQSLAKGTPSDINIAPRWPSPTRGCFLRRRGWRRPMSSS